MAEIHAVTGPFSYTGSYIARRLLAQGIEVRGLVRRESSDTGRVDCRRLQFAGSEQLVRDLEGCRVLYNSYWIRFEHEGATFTQAVENIRTLAEAAARAGVEKIVHISVSNPDPNSPFAYFRGKAHAEDAVRSAGVPASMVRPTLVFGKEDILVNNIAWLLRRFHAFALPGTGRYRVQPVFVDDVAALAVSEGMSPAARTLDAAGPETYTFHGLLREVCRSMGVRAVLVPAPMRLSLIGGQVLSRFLEDVAITDEELGALMAETLISRAPATAPTRLSNWLKEHGRELGQTYTSELQRHWK